MIGVIHMNCFKQLELASNVLSICVITILLLLPSVYIDSVNIYVNGFFINGPLAIAIAIFLQIKYLRIQINFEKEG